MASSNFLFLISYLVSIPNPLSLRVPMSSQVWTLPAVDSHCVMTFHTGGEVMLNVWALMESQPSAAALCCYGCFWKHNLFKERNPVSIVWGKMPLGTKCPYLGPTEFWDPEGLWGQHRKVLQNVADVVCQPGTAFVRVLWGSEGVVCKIDGASLLGKIQCWGICKVGKQCCQAYGLCWAGALGSAALRPEIPPFLRLAVLFCREWKVLGTLVEYSWGGDL